MNTSILSKSFLVISMLSIGCALSGESAPVIKNSDRSNSLEKISKDRQINTESFTGAILTGDDPHADKVTLNDLMGAAIVDREGNEIGRLVDFSLNEDAQIVTAYISIGGFLGLGDTMVMAPFHQFTWEKEKGHFSVGASQADVQKFIENYHENGQTSANDQKGVSGKSKANASSQNEIQQTVLNIRKAAAGQKAFVHLGDTAQIIAGDSAILLTGTLPSDEMHRKLLELVHQYSESIGVIDQVKVASGRGTGSD